MLYCNESPYEAFLQSAMVFLLKPKFRPLFFTLITCPLKKIVLLEWFTCIVVFSIHTLFSSRSIVFLPHSNLIKLNLSSIFLSFLKIYLLHSFSPLKNPSHLIFFTVGGKVCEEENVSCKMVF